MSGARASFRVSPLNFPGLAGAVGAWLRVPLATVTGAGISSLPDVLSNNPAVQGTDAARPPRAAAANGLLVAQGVDDRMSWPANAGNNQLVTWGFAAHIKIDALATGFMALLRCGPTNVAYPAATDSHALGIFTPGQVSLSAFNDATGTLARRCFSTANKLTDTGYVFLTVEYNGAFSTDATKLVMSFDGVADTLSFGNELGAPGAYPASLQGQPGGTDIALLNRRAGANTNPFIGKLGPNIYILGSAMTGVTAGLLTPAARAALSDFERPT